MNEINTAVEKLRVKDSEREISQPEVRNQAESKILEVQAPTQSESPDITNKVPAGTPEVEETTSTVVPISSGFEVDPNSKVGRVVAAKAMGEAINE